MAKLHVTPRERGLYVLALVALASADGEVSAEEVSFIRKRCRQLRCKVRKAAFQQHDLEKIIAGITSRPVQEALLGDLVALAGADCWRGEEVRVIRTFAERWGVPAPPLPQLDWDSIEALDDQELRTESERQRDRIAGRRDLQRAAAPPPAGGAILLGLLLSLPGVALLVVSVWFPEQAHREFIKPSSQRDWSMAQMQALYVCFGLPFTLVGGALLLSGLGALVRSVLGSWQGART